LLEREKAPFGLTFVFTPQWRRLDDTSGAPQESFGFPIHLLADVALSPDKWFAAANLNDAPVLRLGGDLGCRIAALSRTR
jgi:hypothetical protein